MMAGSASVRWAFAAAVGLTVLSRSGVHAQCQASTPATACSSTLGVTTASLMPAGTGNQVWYKYELTEGITYTFYGEWWIGPKSDAFAATVLCSLPHATTAWLC